MSKLQDYIDNHNERLKLFRELGVQKDVADINVPTSFEEAKPLWRMLSSELSPETLHCDGERPLSEVNRIQTELLGVWSELEEMFDCEVSECDDWMW